MLCLVWLVCILVGLLAEGDRWILIAGILAVGMALRYFGICLPFNRSDRVCSRRARLGWFTLLS
jgi:flavin reductase (DIM6/NTAB) family NADH-FMN oxidoreductase RutF